MTIHPYNALLLALIAGLVLWETRQPFALAGPPRKTHIIRNVIIAGLSHVVLIVISAILLLPAFRYVSAQTWGVSWRLSGPAWSQAALAFVLFDGWMYLWHRLNHECRWLWRFHRMHHTDPRLDFSSAFRFHPVEIAISTVLQAVVVILIGIRWEQFLFYKFIFHGLIMFHHSNGRIPQGVDSRLKTVLVSPHMHRTHHSVLSEETNSNYASVFSFWDRIFGSFRERDMAGLQYGLDRYMQDRWQDVAGLLRLPFATTDEERVK